MKTYNQGVEDAAKVVDEAVDEMRARIGWILNEGSVKLMLRSMGDKIRQLRRKEEE